MNHISSPEEPFPRPSLPAALAAATSTHSQGNFRISSRKLPISKAGPIDEMQDRLGIPVPEMIFGDNAVALEHVPTGWAIKFDAFGALDRVDKTDRNMLQVAYAGEWSKSRENTSAGVKEVVKPFDWSYSTDFRGRVEGPTIESETQRATATATATGSGEGLGAGAADSLEQGADGKGHQGEGKEESAAGSAGLQFSPSNEQIPLELLKRRDPILFFDDVIMYESELDDNGISIFSVKVRVHEQRMLLLCRLFMRLDNVVVRIRDTRVYVDFAKDLVLREYTAKEDSFQNIKRALFMSGRLPDDITASLRDANLLSTMLPTLEQTVEEVRLKQP